MLWPSTRRPSPARRCCRSGSRATRLLIPSPTSSGQLNQLQVSSSTTGVGHLQPPGIRAFIRCTLPPAGGRHQRLCASRHRHVDCARICRFQRSALRHTIVSAILVCRDLMAGSSAREDGHSTTVTGQVSPFDPAGRIFRSPARRSLELLRLCLNTATIKPCRTQRPIPVVLRVLDNNGSSLSAGYGHLRDQQRHGIDLSGQRHHWSPRLRSHLCDRAGRERSVDSDGHRRQPDRRIHNDCRFGRRRRRHRRYLDHRRTRAGGL